MGGERRRRCESIGDFKKRKERRGKERNSKIIHTKWKEQRGGGGGGKESVSKDGKRKSRKN